MQAAASVPGVASPPRPSARPIDVALGIAIGLIAPLVSALIYRTYALSLSPDWLEITRQLGAPYVAVEIAVIFYARRHDFDVSELWYRLDGATRIMLGLFLATFWISSVFVAQIPAFSTALCLIWALHLYTAAAVFHLAERAALAPDRLALGFVLGVVAMAVIVIVHLSTPPAGSGPSTWRFGAPIPGFISIRLFGAWVGAVLALLLGWAWTTRDEPRWLYPAIGLSAAVTAWTGTRAALFGLIVALTIVAAMTRGGAVRGFWRKALTAIAIGTLVGVTIPLPNGAGALFRDASMSSADGFASGRLELWRQSLAVAVHRPWLGHGMGSSWWLVSLDGDFHVQPHNALVQFLLNWGVVPTVAALYLLGTATWRVHRLALRRPERWALVMMLDFLVAVSLLDGMLHFPQFVFVIAVLIGAGLTDPSREPAAA